MKTIISLLTIVFLFSGVCFAVKTVGNRTYYKNGNVKITYPSGNSTMRDSKGNTVWNEWKTKNGSYRTNSKGQITQKKYQY